MHELSIADALLRIVVEHAGRRPVARVEVHVGHLRQVVPSALEFAFELVAQGTPVDGAELEIVEVPAAGRCRDCGVQSEMSGFPLTCGGCGSWAMDVTRGEELRVESLELEEQHEVEATTGRADA